MLAWVLSGSFVAALAVSSAGWVAGPIRRRARLFAGCHRDQYMDLETDLAEQAQRTCRYLAAVLAGAEDWRARRMWLSRLASCCAASSGT